METIKVGNYTIGDAEVQSVIAHMPEEQKMFASSPSFIAKTEQNLKDMAAIATYAEEIGLTESENFKKSMDTAKRDVLCQLGMSAIMNTASISSENVKKYYDENPEKFDAPEHASAKHILVETEEQANEIKADIESGKISFEDAAKELSTCPSSANGGDLGMFTRGQMVEEFEDACFEAEVGKLTGPIKTQYGYHLILVDDKHDAGILEFEDIKEQLEEQLLQAQREDAYNAKLVELRERFGINQESTDNDNNN